jgi:hypothetical protein
MRRCYEELLSRNPDARGLVQTRFWIEPDGSVSQACIADATLNDEKAARCVLAEFSSITFAPARGYAVIVYPIRFDPNPLRPPRHPQ